MTARNVRTIAAGIAAVAVLAALLYLPAVLFLLLTAAQKEG
jgi:hypothetical protein